MPGSEITRRRFLAGSAALAAARTLLPVAGRVGQAFGITAAEAVTDRNRLVVIYLGGGNDGLNTVVPMADADGTQRYSVYRQVRPTISFQPSEVLPLDLPGDVGHGLGLHPALTRLHGMYEQGRVAVVQGVDYPSHSFSHFQGTDIVESGEPEMTPDSGWLGRHLDRVGIATGELRAVAVGTELPLIFRGIDKLGVSIPGIPVRFADGTGAAAVARHNALRGFASMPSTEPVRLYEGQTMDGTVTLVNELGALTPPPSTSNALTNALLTARTLLEADFGVECVFVSIGGYDTHVGEKLLHQTLMANLDAAIATFLDGDSSLGIAPMNAAVAAQTLVMTTSEFGRRLGENGDAGTDHGTSAPLFVVGPAGGRLVPGLHGEHPDLGTTLAPADNISATTDLRSVFTSMLQDWLADPDPLYSTVGPLSGLLTPLP
jgi:uncharacterized protein (DUF1501 family)